MDWEGLGGNDNVLYLNRFYRYMHLLKLRESTVKICAFHCT